MRHEDSSWIIFELRHLNYLPRRSKTLMKNCGLNCFKIVFPTDATLRRTFISHGPGDRPITSQVLESVHLRIKTLSKVTHFSASAFLMSSSTTYDLFFTGRDDPRSCVIIGEDTKPVYFCFETSERNLMHNLRTMVSLTFFFGFGKSDQQYLIIGVQEQQRGVRKARMDARK